MTSSNDSTGTPVERPQGRKTGLIVGIVLGAIALVVGAVLIIVNVVGATGGSAEAEGETTDGAITEGLGSPSQPVKIGTVGASEPYWETFTAAALDAGISVELVDFASYPEPNPALAAGEIDVNQFQHIVYLGAHEAATGDGIVPIGSTAIYPLGLYSLKYDSVEDIPDGSTVAIPDDPSNLARGLLVLQSAGLITIEGGGSIFATLDQIDEANSRVTVTTLEAALTVTSLQDVAAAIINNDFVGDATKADGTPLTPDDSIAEDDPSDPNALPYVNIWAARGEDKDNPVLLKLVEIYQNTQAVLDGVQEASGGTAVFLKVPVADLEASLTKVIADNKAQG